MRWIYPIPLIWLALVAATQAAGLVTYTLEKAANPTADQTEAYTRIAKAMDSATRLYSAHTDLHHQVRVQYNPDVATADGSSNGNIRFGSNRSYMQVGTAMHEIAHTLGVGTTSGWKAMVSDGRINGAKATAVLVSIDGPGAVLKGDGMHFWPYGINYESEVKGLSTLVAHCRIVDALVKDMYPETLVFEGRLRSVARGTCLSNSGSQLILGTCDGNASRVRIVGLGAPVASHRLELGDLVLETPGQSRTAGAALGLYAWNRGDNQRFVAEGGNLVVGAKVRLRLVQSGLYVEPTTGGVVQNAGKTDNSQTWELLGTASSVLPSQRRKTDASAHGFDALGRPGSFLPFLSRPTP